MEIVKDTEAESTAEPKVGEEFPAPNKGTMKPNGWEIFVVFGVMSQKAPGGFAFVVEPVVGTPNWDLKLQDKIRKRSYMTTGPMDQMPNMFRKVMEGFLNDKMDQKIITPSEFAAGIDQQIP